TRGPTLDFLFHHHAHGLLLRNVPPEQEITGSLHELLSDLLGSPLQTCVLVQRLKAALPSVSPHVPPPGPAGSFIAEIRVVVLQVHALTSSLHGGDRVLVDPEL